MNFITHTFSLLLFLAFTTLFGTFMNAQSAIKYGPDYIVMEAEDTATPLGTNWAIRTPKDPDYLKYLTNVGNSPDPINDTYLEYIGPWQGEGSEIVYNFICPKTGKYQLAIRMHSPLRDGEKADQRNDFFIKMEGNFTSGSTKHTETDLRTFHKLFGRGANKWGTCINLEHKGLNGVFYNFTEGETYTFTLKGRSSTTIIDYITFYDESYLLHNINNQGPDLALQLPEELRPNTAENLSTQGFSAINFTIFPNPSSEQIRLNFPDTHRNSQIVIYDLNGKVVFDDVLSSTKETIDVSNFSTGLYVIQLRKDSSISNRRLVIK